MKKTMALMSRIPAATAGFSLLAMFCVLCVGAVSFVQAEEQQITIRIEPLHESPMQKSTRYYARRASYIEDAKHNIRQEMNYYWFEPAAPYPEATRFPLVVILHGGTGYSYAGKYLVSSKMRLDYPSFILVPMAPEGSIWSYYSSVSNRKELPYVVKLIEDLKRQYPIDDQRIYVVGCSMGGYGVFGASEFYDDVFAAGVSISGEWSPKHAKRMTKMPLLVMAGERDKVVPVKKTRAIVKSLKRAHAPVEYIEHNMGHYCPASHLYSDGTWRWLFSQRMR